MRIRSIKPEFWASEDIASLDWHDRLLFIGLWSYVDDNGVGRDSEKLIAASLFPLEDDPRETLATLSRGLQTLSERGLITRYSVSNRNYLHVTTWDRHQKIDRPNKARYPLPTSGNAESRETLARPSRHSRETPSPGTEEQGNRGETSSSELRPDVATLLNHLDARINANGAKVPARTKGNIDAARLLLDRDGRNLDEATKLIDWATSDSFWKANILSMVKFREKYDQLSLKAKSTQPIAAPVSEPWEGAYR